MEKTPGRSHLNLDGNQQDIFLNSVLQTQASGFALNVIRQALDGGLLDSYISDPALDLKLHSLCAIPDAVRLGAFSIRPLRAEQHTRADRADLLTRQFLPHLSQLESIQVAIHAIQAELASQAQLQRTLLAATALPGSRPKCTCLDELGDLWVAKFGLPQDPVNVVLWESLAMKIASRLKMGAAEHRVRNCERRLVLFYKRFDRTSQNKLGMFSARSLLGNRTSGLRGESSVLDDVCLLLDRMKQYCRDYTRDAGLLFRQLLFMWLIGVPGDILRKVNFLQGSEGKIWLAPAVGLRFAPAHNFTDDALAESQQSRVLSIKAIMAGTDDFKLTSSNAVSILREQDMLLRAWRLTAQGLSGHMDIKDLSQLEVTTRSIFQVADRVY